MVETLINDLMDLAKFENEKFKFDEEYFSLYETIYEAIQMNLFSIQSNGINIRVEIDDPKDLSKVHQIWGDKRRFLQIIINFVSNAVKFTHQGGDIIIKMNIIDFQKTQNNQIPEELNQLIKN